VSKLILSFLNKHLWISPFYLSHLYLCRFFKKNENEKILFLDIDGTIWADSGAGTVLLANNVNLEVSSTAAEARRRHFRIILVTNQTLFGYASRVRTCVLIAYLINLVRLCFQLRVSGILVCHHHPHSKIKKLKFECLYRKPSPKMINEFKERINFDPDSSIFVGDRITDVACATLAGIRNIFLIFGSRMFEENVQGLTRIPNYLVFSVIPQGSTIWRIFN